MSAFCFTFTLSSLFSVKPQLLFFFHRFFLFVSFLNAFFQKKMNNFMIEAQIGARSESNFRDKVPYVIYIRNALNPKGKWIGWGATDGVSEVELERWKSFNWFAYDILHDAPPPTPIELIDRMREGASNQNEVSNDFEQSGSCELCQVIASSSDPAISLNGYDTCGSKFSSIESVSKPKTIDDSSACQLEADRMVPQKVLKVLDLSF